jgi:hypothetical protein
MAKTVAASKDGRGAWTTRGAPETLSGIAARLILQALGARSCAISHASELTRHRFSVGREHGNYVRRLR